jgi:hypothetical protein
LLAAAAAELRVTSLLTSQWRHVEVVMAADVL